MSEIAYNTKVETPEGPITIKTVLRTPTAVMTRQDDGTIRFALTNPGEMTEKQPVLVITLENGRSLRVGPGQVLLKKGMVAVAARDLKPGDRLENVFAFPAGYAYETDTGENVESDGAVGVTMIEPGGEADIYSMTVERTGRFVFSAGVLGVA